MTTVLIFLFFVVGISGWWLSHQRLTSKPWLESGPDSIVAGTDGIGLPKAKIGLLVFLTVVGMFFALLTCGYLMRQEIADWRTMPLPRILWFTTGLLILGSVSLHCALGCARKSDTARLKLWLGVACIVTVGFLLGQLLAWNQLTSSGSVFTANPANSFFYILTGLHGLHILGGLVALGRTTAAAWGEAPVKRLPLRVELCAIYWHFLLFVWFALLIVMLGWARDPFISAHH